MKKLLRTLILLITAGNLLMISSCNRKKGCTDITASNFCKDCKTNDGSCQYEQSVLYKHVFWFNKSTSDSLIAHGVKKLYCWNMTNDLVPANGLKLRSETSSGYFFNSAPSCESINILTLSWYLKKGESATLSFQVIDSAMQYPPEITTPLRNWIGTITISPDVCTTTQLVW
ncbi:MAG: hypothetical protein H0W73_15805 [Bacteroidetes bacterium]|nr:hypothetical protein [Bacteroidota bacterium]